MPTGTEVDDDKTAQDQAAADSDYHRTDEQVYILVLSIIFQQICISAEYKLLIPTNLIIYYYLINK